MSTIQNTRKRPAESVAPGWSQEMMKELANNLKGVWIQDVVKGGSMPAGASWMSDIFGGVIENHADSDRFEAAVHTDKGPKTLRGSVTKASQGDDIQSGRLVPRRPATEELEQAIRSAHDNLPPTQALGVISAIWERLDRTSELAAARSRILTGKIDRPLLAALPAWFEEQAPSLFETEEQDEMAANPLAVKSAELLVCASLAAIRAKGEELQAEVGTGPMGRVIVDWLIPEVRLQWMVEAIDVPWPCVKVYQLAHRMSGDSRTPAETRILHNALDVIDWFVRLVPTN